MTCFKKASRQLALFLTYDGFNKLIGPSYFFARMHRNLNSKCIL